MRISWRRWIPGTTTLRNRSRIGYWPMLYPRPDRPVDQVLAALLSHVDRVAGELGLAYFVGGAFARDLILVHVHGFNVPRPTRDVDIGIAVRNWEDFDQVIERLTRSGEFSSVHGVVHRLMF
jgi:predicted nucleotidyltransferase